MRQNKSQGRRGHALHPLRLGNRPRLPRLHLLPELVGQAGDSRKIQRLGDQPLLLPAHLRGVGRLPIQIDGVLRFYFKRLGRFRIDRGEVRIDSCKPGDSDAFIA